MYTQRTGQLWCISKKTDKAIIDTKKCYSGAGPGKNNPDLQDIPYVGPVTRGTWTIGPGYSSPKGTPTFRLWPWAMNEVYDTFRDPASFLIHAESSEHPGEASEGCIVCDKRTRDQISKYGGGTLWVVR